MMKIKKFKYFIDKFIGKIFKNTDRFFRETKKQKINIKKANIIL